MIIKTSRLLIRPIETNDLQDLFNYRSNKIANQYQGWIPETLHDAESFIAKNPRQFNLPETWFQLAIVEEKSKNMIGDIGLHFMDTANAQVEIGCTLCVASQKQGFATEALRAVILHLFQKLNKHRIIASVDPANISSIHLLKRLGFRKEAHFKESLLVNNQWVDDVIYALLQSDLQ